MKPLSPASALDHAFGALAKSDFDWALRRAIPALSDPDTQAPAADAVARALRGMGEEALAKTAFERAVALLTERALVPHAVAAAIALREMGAGDQALRTIAKAFGADSPEGGGARPPSLAQKKLEPLDKKLSRDELVAAARAGIEALPKGKKPESYPRYPLWSALPEEAFVRFSAALTVRVAPQGETLVREGEPGESAFILARGEVRVMRGTHEDLEELAALGPGSVVGEMALVTDAPRAASVLCAHAVLILEAPRSAIDEAARELPALGTQIIAFFHKRLVENTVRTSALLSALPPNEREGLASLFETRAFDPGTALINEGDETPGLYLIAAGRFAVTRVEGNDALRLATLGPGMCVGEIGLVLRRPATANVIAETAGVALVLPGRRFMEVVRGRPTLLAKLYELAVQREDETRSVIGVAAEEIDEEVML